MKQQFTVYVLMLITLIGCKKKEEEVAPELTSSFDVTYSGDLDKTIYPSMIFGLSEIEKQNNEPMEYFEMKVNPNVETDIKITIKESKLNFETIVVEKSVNGSKTIIPSIKWKYDELKKLTQPGNVDLTFVCYGNDNKELGRKDLKLSYRSINECVFIVNSGVDGVFSLHYMFAGYVNEDSPVVDGFLKDVLEETTLTSFIGYQGSEDNVDEQVKACFLTLREKGIKYSSITNTSNTGQKVYSQYVRFSDEVLTNSQANCVDGTAFFCSVLEKVGIHTFMVLKPGHMYFGYYLDDAKTKPRVLETTAVGNSSFSFVDALNSNVDDYNDNISKLTNDIDILDQWYLIDIGDYRKVIKPIGR